MHIFALLGIIMDDFMNDGDSKIINDDGTISISVDNENLIHCFILPVCDSQSGYCLGDTVLLNFAKNPCNNRGTLDSISFVSKCGVKIMHSVKQELINRLTENALDELYYQICDEIML